jgi:hypothetical protein
MWTCLPLRLRSPHNAATLRHALVASILICATPARLSCIVRARFLKPLAINAASCLASIGVELHECVDQTDRQQLLYLSCLVSHSCFLPTKLDKLVFWLLRACLSFVGLLEREHQKHDLQKGKKNKHIKNNSHCLPKKK